MRNTDIRRFSYNSGTFQLGSRHEDISLAWASCACDHVCVLGHVCVYGRVCGGASCLSWGLRMIQNNFIKIASCFASCIASCMLDFIKIAPNLPFISK